MDTPGPSHTLLRFSQMLTKNSAGYCCAYLDDCQDLANLVAGAEALPACIHIPNHLTEATLLCLHHLSQVVNAPQLLDVAGSASTLQQITHCLGGGCRQGEGEWVRTS